jgi:hypothetical protein
MRDARGAGFRIVGAGGDVALRAFEAHPREIEIPGLAAFDGPRFPRGERVIAADDFGGPPATLPGARPPSEPSVGSG